jgi:hypothetical protein
MNYRCAILSDQKVQDEKMWFALKKNNKKCLAKISWGMASKSLRSMEQVVAEWMDER